MDRWFKIVAVAALIWILVVAIAPTLENPVSPFRALRMALATMLMLVLLPLLSTALPPLRVCMNLRGDVPDQDGPISTCRSIDLLCTRHC